MQIIEPINTNDLSIVDTDVINVQEDWADIAYPAEKLVAYGDIVYQAIDDIVQGTPAPSAISEYWLEFGVVNKLKPFDGVINSAATRDSSMWFELNITAKIEGLSFLSMRNVTSISISIVNNYTGLEIYQNTVDLFDVTTGGYGTEAVLVDLPRLGYHNTSASITLFGNGTLYVGGILFGEVHDVGPANYGFSTSIIDYSTK